MNIVPLRAGSPQAIDGLAAYQTAVDDIFADAEEHIYIFSHKLDPKLFDRSESIELIKKLAVRSQFTRVNVLFQTNQHIKEFGHQLLHLARRLPSHIELRLTAKDYRDMSENFIVVDSKHVIYRQVTESYDGMLFKDSEAQAKHFTNFFRHVWEISSPDAELRTL